MSPSSKTMTAYCLVALTLAAPEITAAPEAALPRVYVVKKGDTLSQVARLYGLSARKLAAFNDIRIRDTLSIGQRLRIPRPSTRLTTYRVTHGDTLEAIARQHALATRELARYNAIKKPDRISIGQVLIIPRGADVPADASATSVAQRLKAQARPPNRIPTALDTIPVVRNKWKHIVIHHSASNADDTESMDRYHRQTRKMENGLAYHFVIGNGRNMALGQIDIGNRWRWQLDGGHLASDILNAKSIGICLVGNFDHSSPSEAQMESLRQLVEYLMVRCNLEVNAVETHRSINTQPTRCPGAHFPTDGFLAGLAPPKLARRTRGVR